jgi:uncharacterized protein with NAD-binding domain and iron-sulfur cluster
VKVAILGGGVAGLTAAHELAVRGFVVDVYEANAAFGGKARSQPIAGTGVAPRGDLPGEHGFRFYPRFYEHVIDTMARIPSPAGGSVRDHLESVTEAAIARVGEPYYRFARSHLVKPYDILEALEIFFADLDFDHEDVALFAAKILQYFTSCDERREGEYEKLSWYDFLDATDCSDAFQRQLRGIPRMLVAMDARRGSALTVGTISMQLMLDFAKTGVNNDRTLAGPTTELWIDPWIAQLRALGVGLHGSSPIAELEVAGGAIAGVRLANGERVVADHYVLAVPLDVAIPLVSPQLGALDPALERLRTARVDDLVAWMVGIQLFLYEDVPLVRGHTFYPDSPWALTSISQAQFWREGGLFRRRYGNGEIGGVISVDISEWDTPGRFVPKPAKQCTKEEVAQEVWLQLRAAHGDALRDELLASWHLDDDLDYSAGAPPNNRSRLLVHPPGSWALRPDAAPAVRNLVLASDYVRTTTNIASMEGANEAARRAVNAILDRAGSSAPRARLWPLVEPAGFARAKRLDAWLYRNGHRHAFELLGLRSGAKAGAWLRRFERVAGIARLDERLARSLRPTLAIRAILGVLGIPTSSS